MTAMLRTTALGVVMALGASGATAQQLVFSGVSPTSDDYQLGVVWSGIAREAGLSMTVVENGTVAGMRQAARGDVDIVGVGAPHFLDAVAGTGAYADDPESLRTAYAGMSAILSLPVGMAQYVVRADSDIHDFVDLAGRSVGIGRPGGNAGVVTQILFDIHGIAESVSGQAIEYGPALEQLAAGTMDATLVWGSIPTAAIDNASRQMTLRFVSPDPGHLEAFRAAVSNGEFYVFQEIPPETIAAAYEGRVEAEGPAHFWTFPYQIMVRDDIDEETVYRLTRALWDNIEQVHAASPALSLVRIETALSALSADLHPGAARFYAEIGLN